ncbi:Chromatin modification-related protein EAF3 [Nakaseomyces bracarensis]|uniref:Chromatin modification-related protein EAF3 n=1 Tax=Nakaseomyces bracarensis TaxID=273131 RepID=A0ABR4NWA4_9SACH
MFEVGGKCLAYHGPLLYEAKILKRWNPKTKKVETTLAPEGSDESAPEVDKSGDFHYFIHYQGWKSSWDEWVDVDRIMEMTEENVDMKKKLALEAKRSAREAQQRAKNSATGRRGQSNSSASAYVDKANGVIGNGTGGNEISGVVIEGSHRHGRSRESSNTKIYDDGDFIPSSASHLVSSTLSGNSAKNRVRIHVPMLLESMLVDDWEIVTKDKKISNLPNPFPVEQILDMFKSDIAERSASPVEVAQLEEYTDGMKQYFDECVGVMLLYKLERLQYELVFYPTAEQQNSPQAEFKFLYGKRPGQLYGVIHLLRLITVLPNMLSNCPGMDMQAIKLITRQSERLLLWIVDRLDDLLPHKVNKSYYTNTSSQYEGVALGL